MNVTFHGDGQNSPVSLSNHPPFALRISASPPRASRASLGAFHQRNSRLDSVLSPPQPCAKSLGKSSSCNGGELACVFGEIADAVAGLLDLAAAMGPPSALIDLAEKHALRHPQHHVVVRAESLGELSDPYVTKAFTVPPCAPRFKAIEVAAHAFK